MSIRKKKIGTPKKISGYAPVLSHGKNSL